MKCFDGDISKHQKQQPFLQYNELCRNHSSDFQINADPFTTCRDKGLAYYDPRCDGGAIDALGLARAIPFSWLCIDF